MKTKSLIATVTPEYLADLSDEELACLLGLKPGFQSREWVIEKVIEQGWTHREILVCLEYEGHR